MAVGPLELVELVFAHARPLNAPIHGFAVR